MRGPHPPAPSPGPPESTRPGRGGGSAATALADGRDARDALALLAASPDGAELAALHRIGPALSLRAQRLGIEGPATRSWRRSLLGVTANRLLIEDRLAALGVTLGEAGIPWLPIKGCDLGARGARGTRVYERPEERPVADVDLLIAEADYPRARKTLEAAGWRSLTPGLRMDSYLLEEGYAWQAADASNLLLEVHHRLWGMVPAGMAGSFLDAATPDPALGPTARRLPLAHAWLLAAVHIWLNPPPRPLLAVWDLERIAAVADPSLADAVVDLALTWSLELPAALAAAYAAGLWNSPPNRRIADLLLDRLRPAENLTARRALEGRIEDTPLSAIVLARLLSFRPSRAGWRSLPRRIWAHPGIVEMETPSGSSWPRRRLAHVLRSIR